MEFLFLNSGTRAMLHSYDPLRIRRFQTPTEIEHFGSDVDYEQLCRVTYTINEKQRGPFRHARNAGQPFLLVQEMRFFLEQAG